MEFLLLTLEAKKRLIAIDDVVEVIPMVRLDELDSNADPRFKGILHYRGDMVPVFLFAESDHQPIASDVLVVCEGSKKRMAFVVNQVEEIVEIAYKQISSHPDPAQEGGIADLQGEAIEIIKPQVPLITS